MTHTGQKHMRVTPIPPVTKDSKSLEKAVVALTEGYETLTRQRGEKGDWAVTFQDLVELEVITEEQANEHIAHRRGL
jgi:hypothetical protein